MLHTGVQQVVAQVVVDFVDTALDGADNAATAYHGVERTEVYALLGKGFFDELLAPVKLVDDLVELRQLFGRMVKR